MLTVDTPFAPQRGRRMTLQRCSDAATGCTVTQSGDVVSERTGRVLAKVSAAAGDIMKPAGELENTAARGYNIFNQATLNHRASSGVKLVSNPGKTTTILGRFDADTADIINELAIPKNLDFNGNQGGFNLLNTPDELYNELGPEGFWNNYNKPFLDAAIERGDDILMATPINSSTLYTASGSLTGYGKEYFYLASKGYTLVDGRMILKGGH